MNEGLNILLGLGAIELVVRVGVERGFAGSAKEGAAGSKCSVLGKTW